VVAGEVLKPAIARTFGPGRPVAFVNVVKSATTSASTVTSFVP
jgi:hypothetical protein